MKGFIPVEIPTKPYIKQHLINLLGPALKISGDTLVGHFLFNLMERGVNDEAQDFAKREYSTTMKVHIPMRVFQKRGHNLNKTNIKHFNLFLQHVVKGEMRFYLDFYIERNNYSLDQAIELMQAAMGLPDEVFPYDTIKKDYYRYREKTKKPMLKGRKVLRKCPFDLLLIRQFERSILEKKEMVEEKHRKKAERLAVLQQELFSEKVMDKKG